MNILDRRFINCFDQSQLRKPEFEGCESVPDVMYNSQKKYPSQVAFQYRNVKRVYSERDLDKNRTIITKEFFPKVNELTFTETLQRMEWFCKGLVTKFKLTSDDKVCFFFDTCKEWFIAANALMMHNIQVVTCYRNLGFDALVHILNETECKIIITDVDSFGTLSLLKDKVNHLKKVIYIGTPEKYQIFDSSFTFFKYDNILDEGKRIENFQFNKPKGDDVMMIMYTSGSTGTPKGVMILHRNLVSSVSDLTEVLQFREGDKYLSYLPLSHVMEFLFALTSYANGKPLCFGSPQTLMKKKGGAHLVGDFEAFKPTLAVVVPRILSMIKETITSKMNAGFVTRNMFYYGLEAKKKKLQDSPDSDISIALWDKVMFNKFKEILGGNIRGIPCGGSKLSKDLHEFSQAVFGAPVNNGYGLTEYTLVTVGDWFKKPFKSYHGNIGHTWGSTKVRLYDVEEMGYLSSNNQGEIVVSGNGMSKGYYKNEEETRKNFVEIDGETWFLTGDIGEIEEHGNLRIIDRKKNVVKLQNSEYVALEKLESIYSNSDWVSNIVVFGSDEFSNIVSVVIPNQNYIRKYMEDNFPEENKLELFNREKNVHIRRLILKDFNSIANKNNLRPIEYIKNIHLSNDEWNTSNGLLTSTMKFKRNNLYAYYDETFRSMYEEMNTNSERWFKKNTETKNSC